MKPAAPGKLHCRFTIADLRMSQASLDEVGLQSSIVDRQYRQSSMKRPGTLRCRAFSRVPKCEEKHTYEAGMCFGILCMRKSAFRTNALDFARPRGGTAVGV